MLDLGKYSTTILSAYAVTIVLVTTIVVVSVVRARKVKRQLAELEARRNG